jgi:hypothetical protein
MKESKDANPENKMLKRWKVIDREAINPFRFEWLRGWQAIFVAILSAAGYGIAYIHELGYNGEFLIPTQFIVLDLTTILITIGKILAVAAVAFIIVDFGYVLSIILGGRLESSKWMPYVRLSMPILVLVIFILAVLLKYPSLWPEMLPTVPMILFFIYIVFGLPLFTQKTQRGYEEKLKAELRRQAQFHDPVSDFFRRYLTLKVVVAFTLVCFIFLAAYFSGIGDARSQTEFLVPSKYPGVVVLRAYGDNLVCANFNKDTKEVTSRVFILRADADPELILVLSDIGPLKIPNR